MRNTARVRQGLACLGCLILGLALGSARLPGLFAQAGSETAGVNTSTRLTANLWLMTSAEYRACCLTTYKCAELRLESVLKAADPKPARPAVVMDLDETVFDNSAFQTYLFRNNLQFSNALWAEFEEGYADDITLVPGAKTFIDKAEALGVTIVYITNRVDTYSQTTIGAMKRLGINTEEIESRIFFRAADGSTDKASRRETAATRFNVLLHVGDNLRDFSELFVAPRIARDASSAEYLKAIQARLALTDEVAGHWGVDWFILPNPVYGEWERLVKRDPQALMHPTTMQQKVNAAAPH